MASRLLQHASCQTCLRARPFSTARPFLNTVAFPSPPIAAFGALALPSLAKPFQQLGAWLLDEVIPSIWQMAVPKKRSSYRVKRTRQTGKSLKNIRDLVPCPICDEPKRQHHLCKTCTAKALAYMKSLRGKTADHPVSTQ